MRIRSFTGALAILALAACSQGSSIASPGATSGGTPPSGGGGGGGGGTSTATCPAGFATGTPTAGLTVCNITGAILANTTLRAATGVAYRLVGRVDVGVDVGADGSKSGGSPAVLTIEPGVTVFGASGADYLVVNRGSRLEAAGTLTAPIIMTSQADLARRQTNPNDTGGANTSEWGGLVVLGRAPINRCATTATPGTAACENVVEGVTNPEAVYGGATAADNSGTFRYLQIRFAGFAINTAGNELNGITFAGVGTGTSVDYVQVHNNEDDGIEMFGGGVNLKHVVLTGNKDDSFDTDNGWNGGVQYLVVVQNETIGDNIVEASSVGPNIAPLSNGRFSNFTFVGNRTNAFRLNTGTVGRYVNGVVSYGKQCMRWEATAGDGAAGFNAAGDPQFNSVLFDCVGGLTTSNSDVAAANASVAADANNSISTPDTLNNVLFPGPAEQARTAFNVAPLGPFFTPVSYIGAFSPTETPTQNWATGWTFGLFSAATCPTGTTDTATTIQGSRVCRLAGTITNDLRLTSGVIYEIDNRVDVGIDIGATGSKTAGDPAELTIEAGVTLFGDSGADYLVVNRGSKLFSNGTRANPVVFTSRPDLANTQADPANTTAEWGGIVVLGRAPINRCATSGATPGTVACENVVEGVTNPEASYGGALSNDSSGNFTFTLVKFAGFAINTAGNELNGITFAGVGSGSTVDYVQVHNNEDDGIELFGGGVNLKHVVLTGNKDDSFDTDNGWNGNVQYMIVVQNETIGDNIVEASSVGPTIAPLSNARVSNFTFVGNRTNAFRLNTGTVGRYVNGVVSYGKQCMRWEPTAGDGAAGFNAANDPQFNSVLFDCTLGLSTSNSDVAAAAAAVAADANNSTATADSLINVFINGATERGRTAFNVTTLSPFFEPVTHIGAVRDAQDTWWQGWSCGLETSDPC